MIFGFDTKSWVNKSKNKWDYIKQFHPCFWPRLPKTLEISEVLCVKKLSFVMLMEWLWTVSKDGGWLPMEPTIWLEGWNFQSYPWLLGRGDGLEVESMANDLINHTCEMKPPWKPKGQSLESFWVGEHVEVLGEWHLERTRKLLVLSPYFALCFSSS